MKKLILSAAVAAFALGVTPSFADSLPVNVVKTKIPEGCEYKKIPGKKKKELVCIDEVMGGGDGGGAAAVDVPETPTPADPVYNGKSNNLKGANNGGGNGTADGTPGNAPPKDEPTP